MLGDVQRCSKIVYQAQIVGLSRQIHHQTYAWHNFVSLLCSKAARDEQIAVCTCGSVVVVIVNVRKQTGRIKSIGA